MDCSLIDVSYNEKITMDVQKFTLFMAKEKVTAGALYKLVKECYNTII
jgi:hypothetical protein